LHAVAIMCYSITVQWDVCSAGALGVIKWYDGLLAFG